MSRAYTMREMKSIVHYLVENKYYGETKGKKMWIELANSSITDRSWQSLKENFLKRILPDISNPYYGLSMEQIRSFRMGRNFTAKDEDTQDLQPVSDNVKASSSNPSVMADNIKEVHDGKDLQSLNSHRSSMEPLILPRDDRKAGEDDSQSINSHCTSPMESLILSLDDIESSNQDGGELNQGELKKCSENTIYTKFSHENCDMDIDVVVEVIDNNATEEASLSQNGRVSPTNVDNAMLIPKNSNYTQSQINKSLPLNNEDKSPNKKQFHLGASTHEKQTNRDNIQSTTVFTNNIQSKSVVTSDSYIPNNPEELLKGFNSEEIAKAKQEKAYHEAKRRNSRAYSNRGNAMTDERNVITINDSHDREKQRINGNHEATDVNETFVTKLTEGAAVERSENVNRFSETQNPMCSKSMQASLGKSVEDQRDRQSSTAKNSDPNKKHDNRKERAPKEKGTNEVNSHSDSDSDDLIQTRKRIRRRHSIARMPNWHRKNLERILRMSLENLEGEAPRRKCNCSRTCALSKNAAESDSSESATCHRSCECNGLRPNKRISRDCKQPDLLELSSSDCEIAEPPKSPKEEREFWKEKFIDQQRKTHVITQSLRKMKTKLDGQEYAVANLRKQLANDKNFAVIDLTSSHEEERQEVNDGSEGNENGLAIHIVTKNQDIRLKGDWREICSEFKEILKIFKIVSPTKSNENAASSSKSNENNTNTSNNEEGRHDREANNVTVRRGRKAANDTTKKGTKGQSARGRPKSKNNKEKNGTTETPTKVRKSPRIRKLKRRHTADKNDGQSSSDSLKLPASISSPAMSFIQSLIPNDYQDSILSSSKTKHSLCEERRTQSHFVKNLSRESPNIRMANFSKRMREPDVNTANKIIDRTRTSRNAMQGIYDNNIIFNETQTNLTCTTSSITLPPTPEISSIKNMYSVNRRRLSESIHTYTMAETDVSMPLLNQDCQIDGAARGSVFKENTLCQLKDHSSSNDTNSNTKAPLKSGFNKSSDEETGTQSLFALFGPLKEKIKSLFPGRAKETKSRRFTDSSIAVLDKEKSLLFDRNVMKTKKSKRRSSTPFKRNSTRKSKPKGIEPIIKEGMEFCAQYSQNEPSINLLQHRYMSNYNMFENQYKKIKTEASGKEKTEAIIKVKTQRPFEMKKKFISKSSKASLCGSSDIDSNLLQDSFELIHNHSETCLFANEQSYAPPPRSLSATATAFNSTTIFEADLLNSDANDCYSPNLNNTFSGSYNTAASNDVIYDGSMIDDLSREISPQPRLRVSMCNLILAKEQLTNSTLYP